LPNLAAPLFNGSGGAAENCLPIRLDSTELPGLLPTTGRKKHPLVADPNVILARIDDPEHGALDSGMDHYLTPEQLAEIEVVLAEREANFPADLSGDIM
jgi:hypothetical protein